MFSKGGIDFDEVHVVAQILPYGFPTFGRVISKGTRTGGGVVRRKELIKVHMAASAGKTQPAGPQAWADQLPGIDGVANGNIGVVTAGRVPECGPTCPQGAQSIFVALKRETGQRLRCAGGKEGVLVGVAAAEDVDVYVDETWCDGVT